MSLTTSKVFDLSFKVYFDLWHDIFSTEKVSMAKFS